MLDKYRTLSALSDQFSKFAAKYASVIVSELHLPLHLKTIRPTALLNGLAGGEKYLYGYV